MWEPHIPRLSFDHLLSGRESGPAHRGIVRKHRSFGEDHIRPINNRFAAGTTLPTPVDTGELRVILGKEPFCIGHDSNPTTKGFGEFTERIDCSIRANLDSRQEKRFLCVIEKGGRRFHGCGKGKLAAWFRSQKRLERY